ncbi:protein containing tetratricopeptide repeats [Hahella chejuensis KCTC 2396]|uniref:Protein containing tetratricopeptide repeats n=1 Tax=Hahella chejuensis (strain KCTC 2396) TaxID=349521 RepID=Q2SC41_HAHCH|nr:tetratricopeptide repeat protein [Hahella chejuensis]ABC31783.1 protein containing tetratricopeptide repeats [Hahella chejuensis KCTC 2396]
MSEPLSLSPANREWLLALAFVYLQQNHHKKALTLLQATAKLCPEDAYVTRGLAFACLKAARYKDALTLSDRSLRELGVKPETAPFLLIRSHALWALERPEEARKSLKKYHQLTRNSVV